jgi:hypothetical protein
MLRTALRYTRTNSIVATHRCHASLFYNVAPHGCSALMLCIDAPQRCPTLLFYIVALHRRYTSLRHNVAAQLASALCIYARRGCDMSVVARSCGAHYNAQHATMYLHMRSTICIVARLIAFAPVQALNVAHKCYDGLPR